MKAVSGQVLDTDRQLEKSGSYDDILRVKQFYDQATRDYYYWDPSFNMHFGYYKWGMNPFDLKPMLRQMNYEVFKELHLDESDKIIVDAGCGIGASAIELAGMYPDTEIYGLTISPTQVYKGRVYVSECGLSNQVLIMQEDYTNMPFADNGVDAVYAIESSCYAKGDDKKDLMEEIFRVLKPGGRFVIADGFLKGKKPLKGITRNIYRHMCDYWALDDMARLTSFMDGLGNLGFTNIEKKNVSFKVAPSAMHIPATLFRYLVGTFFKQGNFHLSKHRRGNMLASCYGLLMGFHLHAFGYFLISGQKP